MKKVLLPAAVLMFALAGCAAKADKTPTTKAATTTAQSQAQTQPKEPDITIDTRKEVAYLCGAKAQNKLNVMYGLKGNDVVAAQVKYQGALSPVLFRDTKITDSNTFTSESGIIWSAAQSTGATVDKVNGLRLLQPAKQTVNGKEVIVSQVVTGNCKLDKKGTAALAKVAAAAMKKTTK